MEVLKEIIRNKLNNAILDYNNKKNAEKIPNKWGEVCWVFIDENFEEIADELLALIEQEKKEAVKEFVKWYKKVLEEDYDDKAKLVSINLERNNDKDFWYFTGQCTAIQRLITLLDRDLKKFLEENDNADR